MASSDPPIRWGFIFGGHQFFVVRLQFKYDRDNKKRPYIVVSDRTSLDSTEHPIIAIMTYMMLANAAEDFNGTDDLSDAIPMPVDQLPVDKQVGARRSGRVASQGGRLSKAPKDSDHGGRQGNKQIIKLAQVRYSLLL
jgi:hypothetical protein